VTESKKTWLVAEYWASPESLELAQNAFLECGSIGISLDDGEIPEKAAAQKSIRVSAYFEEASGLESEIRDRFKDFFNNCGFADPTLSFFICSEENWQENFYKSCTTFAVDPEIYVVPSFEIEAFKKNSQGKFYVEMDPENAFGSGHHQSTKLCMTALFKFLAQAAQSSLTHMHAIDIGCGSGILAIVAKKLGVAHVVGTEIDADAVITAERNAIKNGVDIEFRVVNENTVYEKASYNLVIANILAPVLITMAKDIVSICAPGATIILSGILKTQADEVIKSYEKEGALFIENNPMDEWCALIFKR
jgi:ribosomal protein L11 methyltransferase